MSFDDGASHGSGAVALATILQKIGASELLPKLIRAGEDDESLDALSKYKPAKLVQKFGFSLESAEAFSQQCVAAVTESAQQATMVASLRQLGFDDIEVLDQGGFSVVFKCTSVSDKRVVAVKFINQPLRPKDAEREGQRLRNCDHENIVRMHKVYPLGEGKCALEMDFVPGGNLRMHLLSANATPERRLPRNAVVRFARQLLLALAYLHDEKGWLHGDIKPENILVKFQPVPSDDSFVDFSKASIQLADFGLTKTFSQGSAPPPLAPANATSQTGILKGTYWYISPEALQGAAHGRERSPADDIWSACLVILEMDTGLNLQQLMISPGSIHVEKVLLNASSLLLSLLYCGLNADTNLRCRSARELLRMLDANGDHHFEWQQYDGSDFVPVIAATAFCLESGLISQSAHVVLPFTSPLNMIYDIQDIQLKASALGRVLSPGDHHPIRRALKESAIDSGGGIAVWQHLVDGKEWLQCGPAQCAQLEAEFRRSNPSDGPPFHRRILLQPSCLGDVQIPFSFKAEPYIVPALDADVTLMNARVHDSLSEWDVAEMSQVVNLVLARKYASYRHRVACHCNGDPRERLLFHFCPDDVIPMIWEQGDGHDPRMSRWAEVGQGAYFAEHPMYGYAYKYKLFPSPTFEWSLDHEPPIGSRMKLFASLVTLGQVADMGIGCESCQSPPWAEWKKEFERFPKPTKPPLISLSDDEATRRHLLSLTRQAAPRYDSVSSTEGDLNTHLDSEFRTPSGHKLADVMHPRVKEHARQWAQQFVVFDAAASYPLFLVTLQKVRESPVDRQSLQDRGYPTSVALNCPAIARPAITAQISTESPIESDPSDLRDPPARRIQPLSSPVSTGQFDTFVMPCGKIEDFHKGLFSRIGFPNVQFMTAMEAEHTSMAGCDMQFTTRNYGITTTARAEWGVVVRGEAPPPEHMIPCRVRVVVEDKLHSEQARRAGLRREEVIAVLLFTGPMYMIYNCILARWSNPAAMWDTLRSGNNLFTTTLSVLASAVQKLSAVAVIPDGLRLYRGTGGLVTLPEHFWQADELGRRGMTEWSFLSTSTDKSVALGYSGSYQNAPHPMLLEIETSSTMRGADLHEFDQYQEAGQNSRQITFLPFSYVEPIDQLRVEEAQFGPISIVSVRVTPSRVDTLEHLEGLNRAQPAHQP
jgi:serine/threonine protein kinase